MKLLSIHLPDSRPKALGYVREIDLRHPLDPVLGWTIAVRGPAVLLICPDGQHAGGYEFGRSTVALRWDSVTAKDYDTISNWTSEPLRRAGDEPVKAKDPK